MRSFFIFLFLFLSLANLSAKNPDRLEVVVISDNNLCDDTLDPTGSAYAVIIEDDGKEDDNLKDFTVNWFSGTSTAGTPIHVGPSYDQMAAGTYTVQAIHDKSAFTDEVEITIQDTPDEGPDAYVDEVKNAKNCKENDGSAKVRVQADFPQEGPDHSHDNIKDCKHGICWNFVWYEGNNPFIGDVVAVGADAKKLKPGTYAVVVTNENNGCQTVVSLTVGLDAEVPVVEGNVVASITDCADPTAGELTAFVADAKNNNKFEFDWYIGDFVKNAPDYNNRETITGLTAGNYTVVAKEKSSGCPSNPVTLTVEDLTSTPVIVTNLDLQQTSCDATSPTGAVSATGDGATTGYDFEWFEGQNTLDENLIGTSVSLTGLAAGFYTVRATNTSDPNSQNCFSTAEIEVTEALSYPDPITATVTDQTYCANPNGSIVANVGGNTADYTFYWFDGNIASPDINSPDFTGATYENLLAGAYTLIAENTTTSCASDPQVFTVADLTATPTVALASSTELTACDSPNGTIAVTADGGTAGYDFRWFNGSSTAAIDEITPSPGASITALAAGTYTVLAENTTTGCFDTYEHTVLDLRVTPVPAITVIDQTQCSPLDGEIQANVGGNTTDYNFYWFNGNVASPDINSPDLTGATIGGLTAGEYTLVVEDDASKCTSAAQVLTVDDLTPTISGTINLVAAQTSCDTSAPNGEITAAGSGGTSYTYDWYPGTDTSDPTDIIASTANISGLSAQTYTVLITDASGCTEEVSFAVPSAIAYPNVDIENIVANSICDPDLSTATAYNGSIEASVGGNTTDYTFYWFDGDVASPDITSPDFTGDTYANLVSGDYTIVVVEDATTCESDRLVVTVPDATPTIGGSITLDAAQTSCDTSAPNGEITAAGSGGTSYTYDWYPGTDTSDPTDIIVSTANISGLGAQTYTVVITDQATGCQEEVSYAVSSAIVYPDVDIDNIVPNSICDPALSTAATYNGAIEASVGGNTTDYTFYWFDGDVASPDITSPDFTGDTYANLVSGDYTIVVVEDATTCESDRLVVTVPDATPTIGGTITLDAAQTSCDTTAPNGEITASGSGGTSYTYDWYPGTDTSDPTDIIVSTANISGLGAQTYTVVITDQATGCQEEVSFAVPSAIVYPDVDIDNIVPNSICDPALSTAATYNGSIEASVGGNTTDYTFYWFDGDVASPDITSPDFTGDTYANLVSGDYTIVVVEDATTCESDRLVVTVPDATPTIGGTITLDAAQTSCDTTAPNGEITASGSGGTSYTYDWYPGTDTSDPTDIIVSTANISALGAQTYTVVITDQATGCQEEVSFAVPSAIVYPDVDIDNIVPNSICDPALSTAATYNGSIEASIGGNTTDYTFYWFDGDVASPDITSPDFTGDTYANLVSGDYTIVVVEDATTCESDRLVVTVPDATPTIGGTITLDAAQTSCDTSAPNGEITAAGSGGTSYTYDWYPGTDTSDPTDIIVSTANISGLGAQTYTVVITDQATGCQEEVSYAVPNDIKKPVINIDPTADITPNSICDPALATAADYNGAIAANVTYDGAAITLADYRFDWYDGNDTSGAADFSSVGANSYTDLAAGEYSLIVTRINAGPGFQCSSEPITVTVTNDITNPTASINKDALQTSCGAPNGQLTAAGASGSGSYSYEWFVGTDATTAFNDGADGNIIGADGETIQNIAAGDYAVRVTDLATGCQTVQNIYLDENIIDPVVDATNTPFVDCTTDVEITPNITSANAAPNGHDYIWYEGQFATGPVLITTTDEGESPILSNINPDGGVPVYSGYYTVVARDRFTGCISEPYTLFVDRPLPQFNVAASIYLKPAQCTDNDGIITAFVDANSNGIVDAGETDYADWTFEWYQGVPTDADANFYTNPEATFLGGALEVDPNNVNSGGVPPASEASPPPVFAEDGTNPNAGATIYSRVTDRYTVVVTDVSTGCKEFLTIDLPYVDGAEVTVAEMDVDNSTNCSTPNGRLEVLDLNNIAGGQDFVDYIYNWYEGTNEDPTNIITDGAATPSPITAAVLDQINGTAGLTPGYYTVVPIETFGSLCRLTPYTVFLDSAARQPVLAAAITQNTSCLGNGRIALTPTPNAPDTLAATTYSYLWSSGEASATISNKLAGDYTVTVTDDNTSCSVTKTYTILDQRVIPDISNITPVAQTFCNGNGSLTIDATEITPGTPDEYTYQVFLNGTDAANEVTVGTTITATASDVVFDDLVAGTYYISATRTVAGADAEGCNSAFIQEDVAEELDPLIVNLSQTANTSCDIAASADGTITVEMETPSSASSIENATYDITFDVSGAAAGASIAPFTTIAGPGPISVTFPQDASDNIVPGVYELTVINNVSNCSVVRSITVEDNPEPIVFSRSDISVESQELCEPDGRIVVNSIMPNNPSGLANYSFGYYTNSADAVAGTNALEDGGGAAITGPELNSTNYPAIGAGIYYVVAYRGDFSAGAFCASVPVRVEIPNGQVDPLLSLSQTANTSCDPSTSSDATIEVMMSMPADPTNVIDDGIETSNFDIAIRNSAGDLVAQRNDVTGTETFTSFNVGSFVQIEPGTYEVELTNRTSTCSITRSITVEDNPEPIVFSRSDISVESQELCEPDGRIVVNSIMPNNPSGLANYSFGYYTNSADAVAGTNALEDGGGAAITGPELNSTNYPAIGAGVYYVVAYRGDFSAGAFCASVPVRVEIPNGQVDPIVSLSQTANTSCDPSTSSDATIEVMMSMPADPTNVIDDGIETSNFDISIRNSSGDLVAQRNDVNGTETFTTFNVGTYVQIEPGTYEVELTNRTSTCSITRSITVEDNPEPIVFSRSDISVESQELCEPDGRIVVNSIMPNNPSGLANYSFGYYTNSADAVAGTNALEDGGGAAITGPELNSTNYPAIGAGIYYVVAYRGDFSAGAFCASVPVRVEIPNGQVDPLLSLSQTANTSCDPSISSDATIIVDMSMPADPTNVIDDGIETSNFDIAIRNSSGDLVAQRNDVTGTETFTSFNVGSFVQIEPGTYEVELTNRTSTCSITRSITVEDNPEPIVFSRSDISVESQELCEPDGRIVVNSIMPNNPSGLANYTFGYYTSSADAVAGTNALLDGGGVAITGPELNSTNYPTIGAGVYYVVAYRGDFSAGAFCESVPVRVEIPNGQVDPIVSLSQTANTSCDPSTSSDATIEVMMSMPADPTNVIDDGIETSNFDIAIRNSAGDLVAQRNDVNGTETFTSFNVGSFVQIEPGTYEVELTNRTSTCSITRSITVEDNPEPIVFSRSDLGVVGQELCTPDGSITVNSIGPAAVGDYTYRWYLSQADIAANNPLLDRVSGLVITSSILDNTNYDIVAGTYYVVASRNAGVAPGSSCSSVAVRVEVPNIQEPPVLTLTQTENTACDPLISSEATLTVTMSTTSASGNTDIDNSGYTLNFTAVAPGASIASPTANVNSPYTFGPANGDLITPGTYTIELTNEFSQCTVIRSITVEDNPEPIVLRRADISVVDAVNCDPSDPGGSITINTIQPANIGNYSYRWYQGETNYTNNDAIAGEITNSLSSLSPGEYYVQAIRNTGENPGSTCISNVVQVEVLDATVSPDIVIVEDAPNSSCDPANPNGGMTASVNGGALADYTFEWFIGLNNTTNSVNASLISGAEGETVSGLAAGNYTVRVTDNTSPGATCSSIESFYLSEDLTVSVAKEVTFDITPQSDCFNSGGITVSTLTPGAPSDFSYEWYFESFDASGLLSGETSASISGQPAGTYYVTIINSATGCETASPIEVEIPNTSTPPAIELFFAKPNTDCNPNTPDGVLEVRADGSQTADYTFTWFEGEKPLSASAVEIGNTNRITELDSGYYSVVVQSTLSNCSDTAQFYVEFLPELPKISLSTQPVTSCSVDNGAAYAQIYNLEGNNFQFNWYIGTAVKNEPDFTGDWLRDVPAGDYVVEAIDLDAPECISEPVSFTITELIEVPEISLNQISPNTYCDPEKVNGAAEVLLYYFDEGNTTDTIFVTSNFEVSWFRTESFPSEDPEFTGRINTELSATEYTVTYRNVTTDCQWEQTFVMEEDLTVVPPPQVEINEMFNSCEEPNGSAGITASTLDPTYIYNWYYNEVTETPDFEAITVEELEIGSYFVTATDTVSGCVSEPTLVEIEDGRVPPQITLDLQPELCGEYNGLAIVGINEDYEYRSIEWETPFGTAYGESFDEFTAGDYSVTVTGSNGCTYTEEFSITSEINVFNGISPNNDGENDSWEIGCLQGFENNRVEIFNRAGALVFAADNYNNSSIAFTGEGNRGVYAGDKKLPDGTYFYVIIKGDGSEAVTGYLELFR